MLTLLEWAKIHFKHMDLIKKNIKSIEEKNENLLIIHYKDKNVKIISLPNLAFTKEKGPLVIITENTKENLKILIKKWNLFSKEKELTIYFLNKKNFSRWVIKPWFHTKISEKEHLSQGLKTIAGNIGIN